MLDAVRGFFAERGVLEVQTPVLGRRTVADPAVASLRVGVGGRFLQPSPEYHMKRLLAAGAPSVYQIGPAFRGGEVGRWHNPEFTMLEWYRLGFDDQQLMAEVADLVDSLLGAAPCQRCTYAGLLRQRFGIDLAAPAAEGALVDAARGLGLDEARTASEAADLLLADALAAIDAERVFVTRFPASEAALARLDCGGWARRFELIVDGVEVANGYHELADAEELARRMAADNDRRRAGGLPVVDVDDALLAAHRHGLPDCAGVAVGFDRLLALQLGAESVAEVMAFGWQRA